MWYFLLTFFLGASVGSFVNVLIDRTILGQDWVSGRSHCDKCKKTLAWYDMIPILSFVLYRGRARCCKAPLPYRYPIVEAVVGCLFVWWLVVGFAFFRLVSTPLTAIQPLFWLVTGIILLILAVADFYYGVVLMRVLWVGSIMAVLYRAVLWYFGVFQFYDLVGSLIVAASFYVLFWLLYKATRGRGMADGDMYVAMYMGLLLGWPRGGALLGSFVLGAVVGSCSSP